MPKITKIVGCDNRGDYCLVSVVMDDGEECQVYVGGLCEVYYHRGVIKAFVKRPTVENK